MRKWNSPGCNFFQTFKFLKLLLRTHRLELIIRTVMWLTHDLSLFNVAPYPLILDMSATEMMPCRYFFCIKPLTQKFQSNWVALLLAKAQPCTNNLCTVLSVSRVCWILEIRRLTLLCWSKGSWPLIPAISCQNFSLLCPKRSFCGQDRWLSGNVHYFRKSRRVRRTFHLTPHSPIFRVAFYCRKTNCSAPISFV